MGRKGILSTASTIGAISQSAASFDCALAGEFWPERFNPTQAGSRADGGGSVGLSNVS